MFLSKIEMDTNRAGTRKAVSTPQILHAAVENCFPDKAEGKDRKLWRLEHAGKRLYLLLLSPERPDFSGFCAQFCPEGTAGESKNYSSLLARLEAGQRWHFRLRGNPTHSVMGGKNTRGKIYAHVTTAYQRMWLVKKAAACGFVLAEEEYDVVESDSLRFFRGKDPSAIGGTAPDKKGREVQLGVATYEGELTITDKALFVQSLTQGVGRAKAYGCGLLTIARPQ